MPRPKEKIAALRRFSERYDEKAADLYDEAAAEDQPTRAAAIRSRAQAKGEKAHAHQQAAASLERGVLASNVHELWGGMLDFDVREDIEDLELPDESDTTEADDG